MPNRANRAGKRRSPNKTTVHNYAINIPHNELTCKGFMHNILNLFFGNAVSMPFRRRPIRQKRFFTLRFLPV